MKKNKSKFRRHDELGDGFRTQKKSQIVTEKSRKSKRNFDNAIKSKNVDAISSYDDD